ncbi:MAG TPA: signal peptidase I [Sulfurospirillum sp. UBA12182]|nr:MAG TPA: signal peptidase I [Sulfurospirillum sp. UBA12182]
MLMLKKLINFSNSWTGTIVIVLLVIFFVAQAFVIPSGSMKKTLLIGDHLFVKKFSYGIPTPHLPWIEVPVLPDFKGNGHLIDGEKPKRGDIVVFRYPKEPKVHYVKRCLALGGDEIIYQDKHLYLRFHEGDAYMKENFPKEKLHTLGGKLWVLNPFEDKFKGIQYDQDVDLFAQMRMFLAAGELDMKPAIIEELPKSMNSDFNAFYVKVPENEFYMIGDNRDHSNDSRFWGSVPYSLIVGQPWFVYFSWDEDYKVRWNRIGRFIDTIENSTEFLDGR